MMENPLNFNHEPDEKLLKEIPQSRVPKNMHRILDRWCQETKTPYWALLHDDPNKRLQPEPMPAETWKKLKKFRESLRAIGLTEQEIYTRQTEEFGIIT